MNGDGRDEQTDNLLSKPPSSETPLRAGFFFVDQEKKRRGAAGRTDRT